MSRTPQITYRVLQIALVLPFLLPSRALAQGSKATGGLALQNVVSSTLANNLTVRHSIDDG